MSENRATHWQDWANLALAAWLFVSPWILGYAGLPGAAWNAWIVAAGVGAITVAALVQFARWEQGANIVLGLWLILSPWVLGFEAFVLPLWNAILVGIAVALLAAWNAAVRRETPEAA